MSSGDIYIRKDRYRVYFVDPKSPSARAFTLSRVTYIMTESSFTNAQIMGKRTCIKISLDQEKLLDAIVDTYTGEEE